MKIRLGTKSGLQKFIHAREYHKFANGVHQHVEVAFACDLSCRISHYIFHSLCRKESLTKSSFSPYRVHLVGFAFALNHIRELDSAHGSEDVNCRVKKIAQSLYRCWLSCKEAFPSSDTKDEWVAGVWNVACLKTGAHRDSLRQVQDEEACLFFVICGTTSLGHSDHM